MEWAVSVACVADMGNALSFYSENPESEIRACELGNESSGSIKDEEILDQLRDYQLHVCARLQSLRVMF
jgi:hypothetical protein